MGMYLILGKYGLTLIPFLMYKGLSDMLQMIDYATMNTRVHNGFVVNMKDGSKKSVSVDLRGLYFKDRVPVNCCVNLHIDEGEGYTPREFCKSRQ